MSSAFAIRQEMNGIAEAPGKTWFWELAAGVIDADRCIQCGTCVAVCPSDSIGVNEDTGLPELVKMCTGCSLCWNFCPRGGLRYEAVWPEGVGTEDVETLVDLAEEKPGQAWRVFAETGPDRFAKTVTPVAISGSRRKFEVIGRETSSDRPPSSDGAADSDFSAPKAPTKPGEVASTGSASGLGIVKQKYAARVTRQFDERYFAGPQDGGVVSAILIGALEERQIDGALVSRESPDEPWKAVPFIARTPDEIRDCAGSFYNQRMGLAHLDLAGYGLRHKARIAVVGTPCEIQGIRAMQSIPWPRGKSRVDSIVLTIALYCTKSFDYDKLMVGEVATKRGIELTAISKVDVIRGKLIVYSADGSELVSEPVKDFHGAALRGCDECADFLGRSADISIGSVGSSDGWSSVLVRTASGTEAMANAWPFLQIRDLRETAALEKLDALDAKIAGRTLHRGFDPAGPLFIDYDDHAAAYAGTDREVARG